MLALDASSGAVVLNVTYGRGTTGQGDGWSVGAAAGVVVVSGLAADAPMVRGMVSTPSVFALNASTGAPVWGFSAFEGPASLSNGSYGPYNFLPIIVVDDKPRPSLLYETADGAVVKHDLWRGDVLWRLAPPLGGDNQTTTTAGCAMASEPVGRRMLVCVSNVGYSSQIMSALSLELNGVIRAIDVASGHVVWQTYTEVRTPRHEDSPTAEAWPDWKPLRERGGAGGERRGGGREGGRGGETHIHIHMQHTNNKRPRQEEETMCLLLSSPELLLLLS